MRGLAKIDWPMVLATDAFIFQTMKSPRRFYKLRQLAKLFLTHAEVPSGLRAEYLCFRSLDRADYQELFESVVGTIQSSKIVVQNFRRRRKVPAFKALLNLLVNLYLLPKLRVWPWRTRLYLYCRVAWYSVVLQKVAKLKFEKLLVFADMQPLDNLLIQYFPDKCSITLQHGLYVDYGNSDTINVANYRNQIANYFLAWGQDTATLIAKYHPRTRVSICGKPNLGQHPEHAIRSTEEYFSVVFDQNLFQQYNFRLLETAYEFSKQTGLKFHLRFHPWNNPRTYSVDEKFLVENRSLSGSRFVIGHTTSLIYELLRIGVPAFKLRSPEYALSTPSHFQFGCVTELQALSMRNFSAEECVQIGKSYISAYGEESLENYREFFSGLR